MLTINFLKQPIYFILLYVGSTNICIFWKSFIKNKKPKQMQIGSDEQIWWTKTASTSQVLWRNKKQFQSQTDHWRYHRERQTMQIHTTNTTYFYLLYIKTFHHSSKHLPLSSGFVSFIHHLYSILKLSHILFYIYSNFYSYMHWFTYSYPSISCYIQEIYLKSTHHPKK